MSMVLSIQRINFIILFLPAIREHRNASSFLANTSAARMENIATSIVTINGTVASLVAKPTRIRIEQNTSVKTASANESSALIPKTEGN